MKLIVRAIVIIFFLFNCSISFAEAEQDIKLIFKLNNGTFVSKIYDKYDRKIKFYKSDIKSISGLEKLNLIEELVFSKTAFIDDFSFLKNLKNIKILVLDSVTIQNLDFVKTMNGLKGLIIQSSSIKSSKFDLGNTNIEYLEITNSGITSFPRIINIGQELKLINLSYNKINDINLNFMKDRDGITIILTGNPISNKLKDIVICGDFYRLIPLQYRNYVK